MPAAVQTTRFQQLLARLFGLRESRAFDVEDIILPTLSLADPNSPELALYRDERLLQACTLDAAAVAAQFSFCRLENPSGSGVIGILESVGLRDDLDTALYLSQSVGVGTARTTIGPRDGRRWPSTARGILDVRDGAEVTAATGTAQMRQGLNAQWRILPWPAVIPPGWSFVVKSLQANSTLPRVTFFYKERAIDAGEL